MEKHRLHLTGSDDGITAVAPVLERFRDFAEFIRQGPDDETFARLRRAETVGRPLSDQAFVTALEAATHRSLLPAKRGPKPALRPSGQVKLI